MMYLSLYISQLSMNDTNVNFITAQRTKNNKVNVNDCNHRSLLKALPDKRLEHPRKFQLHASLKPLTTYIVTNVVTLALIVLNPTQ